MRRAGAFAAAVLLALALGAPGCKPSSLTPFGIGTRDYGSGGDNVNGAWVGTTASGGSVTFQVGNETLSKAIFINVTPDCGTTFKSDTITVPIVDGAFTLEILLDQGRFVATGTFTTASSCSGTYFFEGLGASVCPTAGSGTFVAEKLP